MGPKPFPFPIGIGVDICRVNRVANLLQKENIRNLWARKVFTRLEWPGLCRRLQRANRSEDESARQSERERDNTMVPENVGDNVWMLPKLSKHLEVLSDPEAYWLTVADQRSRLAILTRHLAGRSGLISKIDLIRVRA